MSASPEHTAAGTSEQAPPSSDPSSFLSEIIGGSIVVKLNSGVEYRGELSSVDGYMNIALEKTEEYVGGRLHAKYGDVFIRGNNGLPSPPSLPLSCWVFGGGEALIQWCAGSVVYFAGCLRRMESAGWG
ncbi:hypothetical protein EX30DRAFT_304941 [Ascodesmis nigricans]|uniref:U6 snRNA-associated Sm-like protein LSm6 n=1 Tax=Ascodesmis nigricans TaxID=341454 RepID=A0A4S2N208_9PEZI|nr:hypothetical protein EX30DRAFT_304941 [Ascodesmis nigricans]